MAFFSGLHIAVRGIQANQTAIEVTSHNISNVNTEGYTRQKAIFQTGTPDQAKFFNGQMGSGVRVTDVKRVTDNYLENRMQNQNAHTSFWSGISNILHKVEGDIISLDLPDKLNSFFSSWHKLSLDPESADAKFVVQQEGEALVDTIKTARNQMTNIQEEINNTMADQVDEVNLISEQIANLNKEISIYVKKGQTPNDLLDKRTILTRDLVGMTGATVTSNEDETITVTLGSLDLVNGNEFQEFTVNDVGENGSLGGLSHVRDEKVDSYLTLLDDLASNLIDGINGIHSLIGSGVDFFTGSDASDLSVNDEIKTDVTKINAGEDGSAAVDIYNLMSERSEDYGKLASSLLTKIGAEAKTADAQKLTNEDMLLEMENNLAAVSGVSLDEELTNMMQFQRAYEASAKLLTVIDEMLDTLINRTVG